ncbi:MAG: PAS domain S-box protein [Limnospira sp.]
MVEAESGSKFNRRAIGTQNSSRVGSEPYDLRSEEPIASVQRELQELRHSVASLQRENQNLRTQLSRRENSSQEDSHRLLELVMDHVPQAIFWKDCNSVYLGCNRLFALAAGLHHPREIVGKTDDDLSWTKEEAEEYRACDREVIATKHPKLRVRGTRHLPAGEVRIVETSKIPLHDSRGNVVGVLGLFEDIGDRLQTAELLQQRLTAIESSSDGIAIQNRQREFTYVNRAYLKMFGYSRPGELLGKTWRELYEPDEIDRLEREIIPQVKTNCQWQGELHGRKRDGTSFTQEVSFSLTEAGMVCICRDVTERKQIEATLMLYKQAVECSSDAIGIADAQGHHFYQNLAFSRMFDCETVEEFNEFGGIPAAFIDPTIVPEIFVALNQGESWIGEVEQRSKRDRRQQILLRANAIKDGEGNVIGAIASHTDITERKQAEAALQRTTQALKEAQELAHIGNWEYDPRNNTIIWSDEVFRIFNRDRDLGPPGIPESLEYYHPDDRDRIQTALGKTAIDGTPAEVEARLSSDPPRHVHIKVKAVRDGGDRIVSLFGTIMDVTELKRAETHLQQKTRELESTLQELKRAQTQLIQSEKMSGLGQLVAGVAHEVNNPVGFILGNVAHLRGYVGDLLLLIETYQKHNAQSPEIEKLIEEIDLDFLTYDLPQLMNSVETGARRIQAIVQSLKNFSRLNEAEMKEADIHQGLDSSLTILNGRLQLSPGGPEIAIAKNYGDLPKIECYPGQLNQVFFNIISNAIDALQCLGDEGTHQPPQITITTAIADDNRAVIRIADNGEGMTQEVRSRIFDPFFTTKPVGMGTGLGLSVSYQIIVDRHKGELDCTSEKGKGSEFRIEIPIRQSR